MSCRLSFAPSACVSIRRTYTRARARECLTADGKRAGAASFGSIRTRVPQRTHDRYAREVIASALAVRSYSRITNDATTTRLLPRPGPTLPTAHLLSAAPPSAADFRDIPPLPRSCTVVRAPILLDAMDAIRIDRVPDDQRVTRHKVSPAVFADSSINFFPDRLIEEEI